MGKNPSFPFYPSDWTRDLDDQDLEIEGAWIRIVCRLWWSETRGEDTRPIKEWARILRKTEQKTIKIFQILFEKHIADGGVLDNQTITVISRRMKRDFEISQIRREVGAMGGNPYLKKSTLNLDNQNPNQKRLSSSSFSLHQLISTISTCSDELADRYFEMFTGIKTIQTFDDKGKDNSKARIFHFTGMMSDEMRITLRYMNDSGIGIYMAVNETDGKGRKTENVVRIRSVFADLDGAPLGPAMELNPTLVVESSPNRFHCYWFTEDTPLEAFTYMQKQIARILGGDPKVHDLPRVLRVPGFYHQKEESFRTNIRDGSAIIYKYRDLVEMFPPEPVKQFSGKRYTVKKSGNGSKEFKGHYGAGNGERNNHIIKRIGGMIKAGKSWDYIEEEAQKEADACIPPLERNELMAILKSANRYYFGASK